jgi:class 3 adenylate cyclase
MQSQLTGTAPGAATLAYDAFDTALKAIQGYVVAPLLRTNSAFLHGFGRVAEQFADESWRPAMRRHAAAHPDAAPRLHICFATVLFTDISGFTSLAERMSAAETAAFLARHIRLIACCIADEGGTFDKFVGDAVVAYWRAPQPQPDDAARAIRAMRAIASDVRADNAFRRREGGIPVKLRLGLHAGPVAVGDIGAPASGTAIFGDTVNTGQRIEQLAKIYFASGDDVVGLASAAALRIAGPGAQGFKMQRHRLRGRRSSIAVARIV